MFLDPRQFEFVAALEARWEAIRDEYRSLPADLFDPWVHGQEKNRPTSVDKPTDPAVIVMVFNRVKK